MARLQPARPRGLDPIRRLTSWSAKRMYGSTLQPTGIVAHHRPILVSFAMFTLGIERFANSVESRYKNLAMLRTAQLVGCEWCLDFGSKLAHDGGIPAEDLRELSRWRDSERFGELDRIVLEYAEAMTRIPVEVSDECFERLRERFDERQIVELTMAIGAENLYSRTNWALGIEGEGFSEGMYCVPPDRSSVEPLVADALPR
ncbi:MAG: carboxymuconolactone decarboxylase family protein [Actinomycetota bacterium]|nr:carboxymuconolactone decarboxylase family protein [Actinomycetota bacterium]